MAPEIKRQNDHLERLVGELTTAFWEAILHHERVHGVNSVTVMRTAIAHAVAEIVGSGCYFTHDDPTKELAIFFEEVRTKYEHIMNSPYEL